MRSHHSIAALVFLVLMTAIPALAVIETIPPSQADYERENHTVVRNKNFFKEGRIEIDLDGGVMPYDSTVNTYMLGGRAAWHISDHLGWEILDVGVAFPSVTNFTTGLVSSKGLADLETVEIKGYAGTNLLWSPIYGKVRFIGSSVLFFDIYTVVGVGMANTQTLAFSAPPAGGSVSQTMLRSGFDPMGTLGFGFKFFLNRRVGLVIDMRDYITYSKFYGSSGLRSNYGVDAGLAFFIPKFD